MSKAPKPVNDNEADLPDRKALIAYLSPRAVGRRILHLHRQMDEYKFFPKFMAAKGGLTAIGVGIFMLPAIAVSGVTMTAVGLGISAVGLIAFGAYGAGIYGGKLLKDAKAQFERKILKKPPKSKIYDYPRPPKKPLASPWAQIRKTKAWRAFTETPFAKAIDNNRFFRTFKKMAIWRKVSEVGRDQEVLLRTFATGGSIATVVVTGAVVATQVLALPAIGLSLASAFAVYMAANFVGGIWAFTSHSIQLVTSSKTAFKNAATRKPAPNPAAHPEKKGNPAQKAEKALPAAARQHVFDKAAQKSLSPANDAQAPKKNTRKNSGTKNTSSRPSKKP